MAVSSPHLLQAPHLTNLAQSRPRLAIAHGLGTTEIWASAGAGKTTLLAQWAAELRGDGETAAWISLPAAGRGRPRLPALVRASLAVNAPPESLRNRSGSRVNLILDDVHHLHDPDEALWLAQLMNSPPRGMRIVIAGRHPPSYPAHNVARFGAGSGRVSTEYRTTDLAFTRTETAAFLAARGIHLAPSDVEAVHRRTGGWVAALTLLAGLLPGPAPLADEQPLDFEAPLDFEPGHRATADYLVTEILDLLPATYLSFLLALCVADTVSVPLAVRLSQREDAGQLLNHLELQTGLLSRPGRPGAPETSGATAAPPAYVFHPVLLSYLRTEFRRQDLAAYALALGSAPAGTLPSEPADRLTPKEREILRELPRYQTIRDIAARQRLSPNTVKTHMKALYQKLGVSTRAAAVERASEQGLL